MYNILWRKDLIIIHIKIYIIRMHMREMKTVLVLPRAKCNRKSNFTTLIEYVSVTWVPYTEHNVVIYHVEEIGSLWPINGCTAHRGCICRICLFPRSQFLGWEHSRLIKYFSGEWWDPFKWVKEIVFNKHSRSKDCLASFWKEMSLGNQE